MTREVESLLVPAAALLPSPQVYLAHLEAAADDPTLIRLASNESTEPPSPRVAAALAAAFADAHQYPLAVPLRRDLARRFGVEVEQVLIGAGSTEVIDATLRTFVRAGDEVVVPTPSWPVCRARLAALEARVVEVPLREDGTTFAYDVEELLAAITPRTKLVVACTPNNPTGNSLPLEALRRLASAGPMLLVDAAYAEFEPAEDVAALAHECERAIVTRTFSKAYSLAGLRVGYALGDADVLEHVSRFLVPGSSVGSASLHAAAAALADEDYLRAHVERVVTERRFLTAELRARGLRAFDSYANFVAVDASPRSATDLTARLFERGVLVRPVNDRLVRITVGSHAQNEQLLSAL